MDKLQPRYGVGYHGTPLHFVEKNVALGICGNSLCYYSLNGGPNAHALCGEGYGMSNSAYCSKTKCIAYAEKALKPSIYIHELKGRKLGKLSGVAELEISAFAFSNDGSRFITAAKEPDFSLALWNLEVEEPTKLAEGCSKWSIDYASFNPVNVDHICVSGSGKLAIWMFEKSFRKTSFTCRMIEVKLYGPTCHVWSHYGEYIYSGGMHGEVLIIDTKVALETVVTEGEEETQPSLEELLGEDVEVALLESQNEAAENWDAHQDWRLFFHNPILGKITRICMGEYHIAVIGKTGVVQWIFLHDANRPMSDISEGESTPRSGKVKDKSHGGKSADKVELENVLAIDMNNNKKGPESIPIFQLDLEVNNVTTAEYSSDGLDLLVGSSNGCIILVHLNVDLLHSLGQGFSKRASGSVQQIAQVEWRSTYHVGSISGIVTSGNFVVTSGEDGTLRVWESGRLKELSRQCFKAALTCLDSCDANNMVVCGAVNGNMYILQLDSAGCSAIVFRAKLHSSAIHKVYFSTMATHLVAVSRTDGKLFFLRNAGDDVDEFQLLGYALLQDWILAIAWDIPLTKGTDDLMLLVSLAKGELVKLKVPAVRAPGGLLLFEDKALRRISFRINVPVMAMVVGKYCIEKEGVERKVLWCFGNDKKLQQYRLPDTLQAWDGPDGMPHAPHFNVLGHMKPGSALVLLDQISMLVSGAEDGALQIRTTVLDPLHPPQKVCHIQIYDGYMGGITAIAVQKGKVFTAGANGAMFVCDTTGHGIPKDLSSLARKPSPQEGKMAADCFIQVETEDLDGPSLAEKQEQNLEAGCSLANESYRTKLYKQVQNLRKEFHELFDKNEKAPELEKLSRTELIVDLELESKLRTEGHRRVEKTREEIRTDNLRKDVLSAKIKEECWTVMVEPGVHLWPFCQGYEVPNFPVHQKHVKNYPLATVAKFLRIVEMQERFHLKKMVVPAAQLENVLTARSSSQGSGHDQTTDDGMSHRSNLEENPSMQGEPSTARDTAPGDASPGRTDEVLTSRRSSEPASDPEVAGGAEAVAVPVQEEEEEIEIISPEAQEQGPADALLYPELDLTSTKRKRVQRMLLHIHLLETRKNFNKAWEECKVMKSATIEKIGECSKRITDLQKALGQNDEYVLPPLNRVDNLKGIFEVQDNEIPYQRPLSEEEKTREAQRIEEEQLRLKQGGNAAERALQDMMGGKLEHKQAEVVVEAQMEKPAWMLGNPKKFTKEQLKEIKEFEAKLKAMKEERDKKIRAQEAEQRKLKNDVQDMMNAADALIADLYSSRLKEEAKCAEVEQIIACLSTDIEEEELFDEKKEVDLAKRLDQLKAKKGRSVSALTEFKREVDDFREYYESIAAEDKAIDRNFKKDFADCGDELNLLYKHFKKRKTPTSSPKGSPRLPLPTSTSPTERRSSIKQLPGQGLQGRRRSSAVQGGRRSLILAKADPFTDRPEDVDADHWDRLLATRNRKIEKEEELKRNGAILSKMINHLNKLISRDDANRKLIEKALRVLAEFRENRERRKRDLAFVLHLKQGLVEIKLKPLSGDYHDIVLLPRQIIEDFNAVILREANLKIDNLIAIKEVKRNTHEAQWQISRLCMLETNLTEKIRYIQLLRNTKALQTALSTGGDIASASDSAALQDRLEHNTRLQKKKIEEKTTQLGQLHERANKIKEQNLELKEEASRVHQEFAFQHRLFTKTLGDESKDVALKGKIIAIAKKQKLNDKVKKQADTIEELIKKLEILRKRANPTLPTP